MVVLAQASVQGPLGPFLPSFPTPIQSNHLTTTFNINNTKHLTQQHESGNVTAGLEDPQCRTQHCHSRCNPLCLAASCRPRSLGTTRTSFHRLQLSLLRIHQTLPGAHHSRRNNSMGNLNSKAIGLPCHRRLSRNLNRYRRRHPTHIDQWQWHPNRVNLQAIQLHRRRQSNW